MRALIGYKKFRATFFANWMDAKTKLIATASQVFPRLASTALGSFRVVIGAYVVIGGNWKTRLQYFPKQLASFFY